MKPSNFGRGRRTIDEAPQAAAGKSGNHPLSALPSPHPLLASCDTAPHRTASLVRGSAPSGARLLSYFTCVHAVGFIHFPCDLLAWWR